MSDSIGQFVKVLYRHHWYIVPKEWEANLVSAGMIVAPYDGLQR